MAKRNEMMPETWRGERAWNPIREVSRLQRRIDRMFEDFFPTFSGATRTELNMPEFNMLEQEERLFTPPIDIEETDGHYVVSMDIPGVSKEDIKVEMRDNQLMITGERKREKKVGEGTTLGMERSHGVFQRWLTLPQNVDSTKIEAQYDKGVLRIAIPKTESAQAKPIQIKEESGVIKKLLGKPEKAA